MLFDSHSHLHFYQFDNDREKVIGWLIEAGIKVINVGTDLTDSQKAIDLANKYFGLMWASVGFHPNCISTTNRRSSANGRNGFEEDSEIGRLKELAKDEKVVAIGECGLDYFRSPNEAEIIRQKEIFEKQIEIAKELNKPIILHCRPSIGSQDAYEDAVEILKYKNLNILSGNGVAHFFAGSKETSKKFLDLGFYISFSGPITFANEYKELVEFVPIDRILVETDAPFAAPVPHRGKRNEPAYVEFIVRKIAEWKGLSFEEVSEKTVKNAANLFKIP